MRVLVCGGREYGDLPQVHKVLDRIKPSVIIHGGARGADQCASLYALAKGIPFIMVPAQWTVNFGNSAGPIRNGWMIKHCSPIDLVVAFPGGKGTKNMISQAKRAGIEIKRVKEKKK